MTTGRCPACKRAKKSCDRNCLLKKYVPRKKDYEKLHTIFGGPSAITDVINRCREEGDRRVRAVRCLVKEAKARIEDPEGGAWGIVENLRDRVEELERDTIRAATTLMQLQRDERPRVRLLQKKLNTADFRHSNLVLLKNHKGHGSRANIMALNGPVYMLQQNGERRQPTVLSAATNNRGHVFLNGWRPFAQAQGLVPGDSILLETLIARNEQHLIISCQNQQG